MMPRPHSLSKPLSWTVLSSPVVRSMLPSSLFSSRRTPNDLRSIFKGNGGSSRLGTLVGGVRKYMLPVVLTRIFAREGHWRDSVTMGLISSTFSTLFISLGGRRIGKDLPTSWMEMATTYFRKPAISKKPSWPAIVGGLYVHQSADFAWAVTFFGLMARWTRGLSPGKVLIYNVPWAFVTAFAEYYLILPWLQPIVRMQQPFWTPLTVHLISGSAYPLFPLVRERITGEPVSGSRFARRWALVLGGALLVMALLWLAGKRDREVRLPFVRISPTGPDGEFLRKMTGHHELGLHLADLAAERSDLYDLKKLSELMVAQHRAEIRLMRGWWRSWFGGALPSLTPQERRNMEGMPSPERVRELEQVGGADFRHRFIPTMIFHHEGAISMSNAAIADAADPRVHLLARTIRHAQQRQIERMRTMVDEWEGEAGQ